MSLWNPRGALPGNQGPHSPVWPPGAVLVPWRLGFLRKTDLVSLSQCPSTVAGSGKISMKIGFGEKGKRKRPSPLRRGGRRPPAWWRGGLAASPVRHAHLSSLPCVLLPGPQVQPPVPRAHLQGRSALDALNVPPRDHFLGSEFRYVSGHTSTGV